MNRTVIFARNLSKTFGSGPEQVAAVSGVDLEARSGEIMLLIGPSGSGKTTLLSMIGGILRPTAGTLRIAGKDISLLDEDEIAELRRRHIGFVFQGYNLFANLRAWQNVGIALDVKKVKRQKIRPLSIELLRNVGMEDKSDAFPSQLSGGQKQRVAIARALAGDPNIILADEPTAALDSENGRAVMALLRSIASEQARAVIIVTHDLRLQEYADRITRMEDGRITETISFGQRQLVSEAPVEDPLPHPYPFHDRLLAEASCTDSSSR